MKAKTNEPSRVESRAAAEAARACSKKLRKLPQHMRAVAIVLLVEEALGTPALGELHDLRALAERMCREASLRLVS